MGFDMEMEDYHEDEEFKRKQKEELQKLAEEMINEAKKVREEYTKNPSNMSGSYIHIHENSPYLKEKHERLITFDKKDLDKKKKK